MGGLHCGGCGLETGQFWPNQLPVIRAKIAARNRAIGGLFDHCAAVDWHRALAIDPVRQVGGVRANLQGQLGLGAALLRLKVFR